MAVGISHDRRTFERVNRRTTGLPPSTHAVEHYIHRRSGIRHLHFQTPANDDTGCTFVLAVPTPAEDDLGATHALEHMVLCGSARFPDRDAFFRVERRSIADHLNAVTNEKLSTFHFCTRSPQDFDNLSAFFLDAAFAPLLSTSTFAQEVIRPAASGVNGYDGVVYNEMLGVSRLPGHVVDLAVRRHLLAGSPAAYLAAGNPLAMRALTLDRVRDFHRRYYRPCRVWLLTEGPFTAESVHRHWHAYLESYADTGDTVASSATGFEHRDATSSTVQTHDVHVNGIDAAAVSAWHLGSAGNQTQLFSAYVMLDVLTERSDSLLQTTVPDAELRWLSLLNRVDVQSGEIVLRLGAKDALHAGHAGQSCGLDHDRLTALIAAARPSSQRIADAVSRVALGMRIGAFPGLGNDSVYRLRQLALRLVDDEPAIDDFDQWCRSCLTPLFEERDTAALTRSDAWRMLVEEQLLDNDAVAHYRIVDKPPIYLGAGEVNTPIAEGKFPPVDTASLSTTDRLVLTPLDVTEISDTITPLPIKRDDQLESPLLWCPPWTSDTLRLALFFNTAKFHADVTSQLVCALQVEAQAAEGVLAGWVRTRIDIDTWWSLSPDATHAAGVVMALTCMEHDADELIGALKALGGRDRWGCNDNMPALLQANIGALAERLQRTGHLSAMHAAMAHINGLHVMNAGMGLGLLDYQQALIQRSGAVGRSLSSPLSVHAVSVECSTTQRARLADPLREWLNCATPASDARVPTRTAMHGATQSVRLMSGGVNYLAQVVEHGGRGIDLTATGMVLAATLRNEVLLDALRTRGGAYGAGAQWQAGCLAMFSFRDPRAAQTFADMQRALEHLRDASLSATALHQAQLAALATLRRQWVAAPRKLAAAWQHFCTSEGLDGIAKAITEVDSHQVQALSHSLLTKPSHRFAWVSSRRQHDELRDQGFNPHPPKNSHST